MLQRNGTTARRTTTSRSRPLVLCTLLIGALATATACGTETRDGAAARSGSSSSGSSAAPSTHATSSAPASERTTPSRAESPTASPSRTLSRAPSPAPAHTSAIRRICSKEQLKLSVGRKDVGAGNVHLPLVLTNKSSATCTLTGFPGVSLLDSSGAPIGDPATRRGPLRSTVSLPPGASASASLHTLNEGVSDIPCWRTAAEIRAYPPDSFGAMKVPVRSFRVCGGVFEVEAVQAGAGT